MADTDLPTINAAQSMLDGAIGQIEFARRYTLELLDATPQDRWYEKPGGLPTSIAWQIGHIAVSQYGLLMFRIRGRSPDDLDLIPGTFRKAYGRESVPRDEAGSQPAPDELRERLQRVHVTALDELRQTAPDVLLEPVEMPYAAFPIKLGAILFCPMHEQIHCGQIGLLRRAMGLEPVR